MTGWMLTTTAKRGNEHIVQFLLGEDMDADAAAPVEGTERGRTTALQWAIECGHTDVAELLRRVRRTEKSPSRGA